MKSKFQYLLFGVALTLFTGVGLLLLVEQQAQANEGSEKPGLETAAALAPSENGKLEEVEIHNLSTVDSSREQSSAERNTVSFQGSVNSPETDFDVIIAQIREFADRYETGMLEEAGWVHRVSDHYMPVQYVSNTGLIEGTPVTETRPHDLMRKEQWFLVQKDGTYMTSIGHDLDEQGVIRNRWAFTEGNMVFLDLPPTSEYRVQDNWPPGHISLHEHPLWYLQVAQSNNQTVKAWYEDDTYIVVVTIVEEEPVELSNVGITAISREREWIFDMTTGALKSAKQSLQASDGTWVPGESEVIIFQERIAQPPTEALDTLNRAQQIVQEVQ